MNLIELIAYAKDQLKSGKSYQDVGDDLFWNMGVDKNIVRAILDAIKEESEGKPNAS